MQEEITEKKNKPGRRQIKKCPRPPKKITERYLYNSGLSYLQRFPASAEHFKTVMRRKIERSCRHHTSQDKEACETMLEDITAKFRDMGLLDDRLYTKACIETFKRRGLSEKAIAMKLKLKGIDSELLKEFLDAHPEDDIVAALRLSRKRRCGPFGLPEDAQNKKHLSAFARSGFSYDTAKKALEMEYEEAESILSGSYSR